MQKKGQLCHSAVVGSQGLPKQICPAILGNIVLGWPLGGDFWSHYFHSPEASQFSPAVNCCVLCENLYLFKRFRHGEQRLNWWSCSTPWQTYWYNLHRPGEVFRDCRFSRQERNWRRSLTAFSRVQAVEFSLVISVLNLVAIEYAVRCHKSLTNFHYLKVTNFSCWEMFLKQTVPYPRETFVSEVDCLYKRASLSSSSCLGIRKTSNC